MIAYDSALVCTNCFQYTTATKIGSVVPRSKCTICGEVKTGYEIRRDELPVDYRAKPREGVAQQGH